MPSNDFPQCFPRRAVLLVVYDEGNAFAVLVEDAVECAFVIALASRAVKLDAEEGVAIVVPANDIVVVRDV